MTFPNNNHVDREIRQFNRMRGFTRYSPSRFKKQPDPDKEQKAADKRARKNARRIELKDRQSL